MVDATGSPAPGRELADPGRDGEQWRGWISPRPTRTLRQGSSSSSSRPSALVTSVGFRCFEMVSFVITHFVTSFREEART